MKVPDFLPLIFISWLELYVIARFICDFISHEGVSTIVSSRFTVPFIIPRLLACAKVMRQFPTTIAGFTMTGILVSLVSSRDTSHGSVLFQILSSSECAASNSSTLVAGRIWC